MNLDFSDDQKFLQEEARKFLEKEEALNRNRAVLETDDKFDLPKRYFKNIEAFIYGKNKNFFVKKLKGKIRFNEFNNIIENFFDSVLVNDKNNQIKINRIKLLESIKQNLEKICKFQLIKI